MPSEAHKERKKRAELKKYLKKMAEHFPNLVKDANLQI